MPTEPRTETAGLPSDTPRGVQPIRTLLMARHAEDLPTADALNRHDDAEASLIYLSENDGLLMVRGRALSSLRFFPTERAERHLMAVLRAENTHPKLLAAALQGVQGRDSAEVLALVRGFSDHADPRVRRAAAQVRPSVEGDAPGALEP